MSATDDRTSPDVEREAGASPVPVPDAAHGSGADPRPIVFYDGECALCSGLVRRILRADRSRVLVFASLQGRTAAERLSPELRERAGDSMIYLDENGVHVESDAALAVARRAGGAWKVAGLASVVPRPLRDAVYRWVARHRRRLVGRGDGACLLPTEDDARFLP